MRYVLAQLTRDRGLSIRDPGTGFTFKGSFLGLGSLGCLFGAFLSVWMMASSPWLESPFLLNGL